MVEDQLYTSVQPMDTCATHQFLPSSTLLPYDLVRICFDSKVPMETIDEKDLPTWKTKVVDLPNISTILLRQSWGSRGRVSTIHDKNTAFNKVFLMGQQLQIWMKESGLVTGHIKILMLSCIILKELEYKYGCKDANHDAHARWLVHGTPFE
mgnify:FL=1